MRRAFLLAIVLAMAPVLASASDGALEINQACVATGCFAGDAAGFPVTTAVGKRYLLTGDLTVPANGSAITVAAAATLDLGGFAISGPVTCTGSPAVCVGAGTGVGVALGRGAVLRNGSVRGMSGSGVSMEDLSVIENVLVEQNGVVGIFGSPDGGIVRGCRMSANGSHGINFATGNGAPGALVTGTTVVANGGDGIRGAELNVLGNTIVNNAGLGLNLNFISGEGGFGQNLISYNNGNEANPQTSGGIQIGTNICGGNTACP